MKCIVITHRANPYIRFYACYRVNRSSKSVGTYNDNDDNKQYYCRKT